MRTSDMNPKERALQSGVLHRQHRPRVAYSMSSVPNVIKHPLKRFKHSFAEFWLPKFQTLQFKLKF